MNASGMVGASEVGASDAPQPPFSQEFFETISSVDPRNHQLLLINIQKEEQEKNGKRGQHKSRG
jgi:hypothetical protein